MKENLLKMILAVAALAMALETTWAHGLTDENDSDEILTQGK